jgi:hypothetical protein
MKKAKVKNVIVVLVAGLLVSVLMPSAPLIADDNETSVTAEVEVLEGSGFSYGAVLIGFWNTWWSSWSLGKPDGRAATVMFNGWINIKLKDSVTDARMISIRAANHGWWPSDMKVSVSADGHQWKSVGNAMVKKNDFQSYEFTGSFGNVKFIKIERRGTPFSWLVLDAAGAKGG